MIFFDLDGTLYRTHETCLPTLYELCAELGILLTQDDEAFLLHTTADALLQRVAPDLADEKREWFKHELKWREIAEVKKRGRLFDGAKDLLNSLRSEGVSIAICGMGGKEYIAAVLERCEIAEYFVAVLHRVEGKTKAEVLSDYIREKNISVAECVMIGDSVTDFTAAKFTGMPFIGVRHGYGAKAIEEEALMAEDLRAVKVLLRQL